MKKRLIIAIDGPAGAGKSTIAKMVSKKLGYLYIDTGAMYRAIAWNAAEKKINFNDDKALVKIAKDTSIVLKQGNGVNSLCVFVDGKDVTDNIRTEKISRLAHMVALVQGVRRILRSEQREMGKWGGVVMEGRDIGTAVFPRADLKFYLDASPLERARRRYRELKTKERKVKLSEIAQSISQRDYKDRHREASPLRKAKDAVLIDSTSLSLSQVADKILKYCIQKIRTGKKK